EGPTSITWLRDGVVIPGASAADYVVVAADVDTTLSFEVAPVSLFAYPPDTARGEPRRATRFVPIPKLPRGTGGPGGVGVTDGQSDIRVWLRADEGVVTAGSDVTRWLDQSGS